MTGDEKRRPGGRRSKGLHAGSRCDRNHSTTDERPAVAVIAGGPFWALYIRPDGMGGADIYRAKVGALVVDTGNYTGHGVVPFEGDGPGFGAIEDVLPGCFRVVTTDELSVCDCFEPQLDSDPTWCTRCGGTVA